MSYLVLARKWRPQSFEELVGQQPIVRILKNSISQGKIAHAYVFSGPRGVGKTSAARILAKGLNCMEGPTAEPCGVCGPCVAVVSGSSVDVIEIDGASNNSVDDIRDLRERVKYAPSGGKYKVYIIDEAHMLSTSAFNALLKTLEEPPPHVVFVLATTESRKIPLTVMSRCQHLPFRRIPARDIRERLRLIASAEGIDITEQAVALTAKAADGSIRDSLTILDQVASFSSNVSESDVKALLDVADFGALKAAASAITGGDRQEILRLVGELVDRGTDLRAFARDLIGFFRDLLVLKAAPDADQTADFGKDELSAMRGIASSIDAEYIILIISELIKGEYDVKSSFSPRVALEMSLLKTSFLSGFKDVGEAIEAIAGSKGPSDAGLNPAHGRPEQVSPREPAAGPPDAPDASPITGETLLAGIIKNIADPKVSSYLARAKGRIEGDTLVLTFEGPEAEICAKPFNENSALIEAPASEIMGRPIGVEIHLRKAKAEGKKEIRQKVASEPVVREALELFEGSIVDVKPLNDK